MSMLEGHDVPRSPAWWFKTLATQLVDRREGRSGSKRWNRNSLKPQRMRPGLMLLEDYRNGEPPIPGCSSGWAEHVREVVRVCDLNFAAKVARAKSNRMRLRGFRTAAENDELGDVLARNIMDSTGFKVVAREVHGWSTSLGDGYTIVTPTGEGKMPSITAEDPKEVITAHDATTGKVIAALKLYRDEWDAADFGYLFIRESDGSVTQHVAINEARVSSITSAGFRLSDSWEWQRDPMKVPHDRMPVARVRNRDGVGEYEQHLGTLDRINMQVLDRVVIAKLQAFRQRAIRGLPETEKVLIEGKLVEQEIDYTDVFSSEPGALWQVPDGVEFWESQTVDLGPLRMAIKDDLIALAAATDTSLPSVTPDASNGSAEGAALMREDQTFAIEACMDYAEPGWVSTMATAFAFYGDQERANEAAIRPLWAPAERFSLSERAAAAAQASSTLPQQAIQRDIWQYDPAEVIELQTLRGADLLFGAAPEAATLAPSALPQGGQDDPTATA